MKFEFLVLILLLASLGDKCVKCDIKDGVAIVKFDTPDSKVMSWYQSCYNRFHSIYYNSAVLQSSWRNWVPGCELANYVVALSKQFWNQLHFLQFYKSGSMFWLNFYFGLIFFLNQLIF